MPPDVPTCNDYRCVFIGEAPGKDEDKLLKPFVGKTGREVNEHYLPLAGLRRDHVTFTNAIKCMPPGPHGKLDINRTKDLELLESCTLSHLYNELDGYRVVVPMGAFACYALDPCINLELQHGIPLETSWGTVFPMRHPAGGLHEPKKMLEIRNDWVRLRKYLAGKLQLPVDPYPQPDYRLITPQHTVWDYWEPLECNDYTTLALDTETNRFHGPYCATFSVKAGTGRLIRANDESGLWQLQALVNAVRGPILWHNYLGIDEKACRDMGLHIPWNKIVDTMVRCFHLGNLPQGLKSLAYRLLGMQMESFEDVVTPYSTPLCLSYLREAYTHKWPKPDEQLVRGDDGNWELYKPQSLNTKIKRFFTDYEKNNDLDVYARWNKWEDYHAQVEAVMGPWPGMDISYVPFDSVLHYSCRDADALIRLWPVLQSMTRQVRRVPQEHWGDYASI